MRLVAAAFFIVFLGLGRAALEGQRPAGGQPTLPAPPRTDRARIEALGLHNVYRITDKLYSGSSPDGEEGFRSLRKLGVKTVLSVDGARPDVALAKRQGLRYVHLPVGYDGLTRAQALRIAKAVRDLPGPVYLHCHHGQHRGPAAAAVAHLCLDARCGIEQAVAELRRAGTDPRYTGLYAAVRQLQRPTPGELDRLPADFPETAKVAALAEMMVGIDQRWDNLKELRAAGWNVPKDHPDLDPPHEALQLVEHYREATRLDSVRRRPKEFRGLLADAERKAKALEAVLREKAPGSVDGRAIEAAFRQAGASCTHCHAKYRDVPTNP